MPGGRKKKNSYNCRSELKASRRVPLKSKCATQMEKYYFTLELRHSRGI